MNELESTSILGVEELDRIRPSYVQLRFRLTQASLLQKQPQYYARIIILNLVMLGLGVFLLPLIKDNLPIQLLDAVFLAFVFGQIGFVGHDATHLQISRTRWKNQFIGLVHWNLLLGISQSWWKSKHNTHHAHPNCAARDPDMDIPLLAFSDEQARSKRGPLRFLIRYQAYFFFPMLLLEGFYLRFASIQFLVRKKSNVPFAESLSILLNCIVFYGFVFYALGFWRGVLFITISHAAVGLYLGMVFATNHKGMPILTTRTRGDFLNHQIMTGRNVKGGFIIDFFYGGLNYQIEHHLFPNLPRNRLREAREIVRAFCLANSLSYHETGPLRSYAEVLSHLHNVSARLVRS